MQTRKPASVFPEPVVAGRRASGPAAMWAQPSSWGGVGPSGKRRANHSATAGWAIPGGHPRAPGPVWEWSGEKSVGRSTTAIVREYRPGATAGRAAAPPQYGRTAVGDGLGSGAMLWPSGAA